MKAHKKVYFAFVKMNFDHSNDYCKSVAQIKQKINVFWNNNGIFKENTIAHDVKLLFQM